MEKVFKQIAKEIKKYNNIIIARHIGPDPDAVCSQIALRDSIKITYPNKSVYAIGKGVSRFKNFGLLDKIDEVPDNALLIVLDVPNIARIDGTDITKYHSVIKIDHHPLEDKMGDIELVDTKACSTAQLITELIINTNLKINQDIAGNLYLGIVSDSERFLLNYTTSETLKLCSYLMEKYELNIVNLYQKLYLRPLNEVRFQGFIATHLVVTDYGFAYLKVSKEDINEYKVDLSTASNMINNFNHINEVLTWAFVVYDEKNDIFKVSMRSRGPIINHIASNYNGGGHPLACGARIKDESDVNKLFNDLDNNCKLFLGEK